MMNGSGGGGGAGAGGSGGSGSGGTGPLTLPPDLLQALLGATALAAGGGGGLVAAAPPLPPPPPQAPAAAPAAAAAPQPPPTATGVPLGGAAPPGAAGAGGAAEAEPLRPATSKKVKPPKKRVKGVPAETYRDRWLKRLPRKQMESWLSGVCSACERPGYRDLLACAGPCMRSFHAACVGAAPATASRAAPRSAAAAAPDAGADAWFCPECDTGRMRCFACGEFGTSPHDLELRKCSLGSCGRFFHVGCARRLPLCSMGASGAFFRCPSHYCHGCLKRCAPARSPARRALACLLSLLCASCVCACVVVFASWCASSDACAPCARPFIFPAQKHIVNSQI